MNNPQLNKNGKLQHLLTTEGLPAHIADEREFTCFGMNNMNGIFGDVHHPYVRIACHRVGDLSEVFRKKTIPVSTNQVSILQEARVER